MVNPTNPPSMNKAPRVKFSIPINPKIIDNPVVKRNNIMPKEMPFSSLITSRSNANIYPYPFVLLSSPPFTLLPLGQTYIFGAAPITSSGSSPYSWS